MGPGDRYRACKAAATWAALALAFRWRGLGFFLFLAVREDLAESGVAVSRRFASGLRMSRSSSDQVTWDESSSLGARRSNSVAEDS